MLTVKDLSDLPNECGFENGKSQKSVILRPNWSIHQYFNSFICIIILDPSIKGLVTIFIEFSNTWCSKIFCLLLFCKLTGSRSSGGLCGRRADVGESRLLACLGKQSRRRRVCWLLSSIQTSKSKVHQFMATVKQPFLPIPLIFVKSYFYKAKKR